jgi:hypothetical protein
MGDIDNLVTNPEALATDNPQTEEISKDLETGEVIEKEEEAEAETPKKDYEAAKERFKQQLEGSKKEVERLKEIAIESAFEKAKDDASSLLELHRKDPNLASSVADKFDWSQTEWGDYSSFLKQDSKISKQMSEDEIDARATKKAEEILSQREHEKALAKASKKIDKLDDDVKELAQEKFNKLIEGKKLTEDDALEYAEMATLFVQKSK